MRKIVIIELACLILSVSIGVGVTMASTSKDDSDTVTIGDMVWGPEIPQLTDKQEAEIQKIVLHDKQVKRIIRGTNASIDDMGPILNDGEVVGATVLLAIDEPVFVEEDWPTAEYVGKGNRGQFKKDTYREASVVDHLQVGVDLESGAVIEIIPLNLHSLELEQTLFQSDGKGVR